jgi:hypothetical protein
LATLISTREAIRHCGGHHCGAQLVAQAFDCRFEVPLTKSFLGAANVDASFQGWPVTCSFGEVDAIGSSSDR